MAKWSPSNTTTYYWANGSQVQQNKGAPSIWTDQSENGRVVQRPSQSAAPSLVSADLNGHDVLEFDGTNDGLFSDDDTEFNFESSDFAVFTVSQRTGGNSSVQTVIDMGGTNSDGYSIYHVFVSGVVDTLNLSVSNNTMRSEGDAGTGVYCSAIVDNGTNAIARLDGATVGTPAAPDTSYASSEPFTIGITSSGSGYFDGKIAEVIVVQATLTDREIEQFEGYLLHKYDLSKFPSAHRFRRFTPAVGLHGVHNQDLLGELALDVSGPLVSDTLAGAV